MWLYVLCGVYLHILISPSFAAAHDGSGSQSSRRAAVRRKWHVTYTLLRNPSLVHTRKVFNQSAWSRRLAAGKAVAVRGEGGQGMESVVLNAVAT